MLSLRNLLRRLARRAPPLRLPCLRQHRRQEFARIASWRFRDVFRRAPGDDLAAAVAAFGAEVDDPVGGLDDFEIVLDDDDRVALRDQLVQHLQEFLDVVEMQAGGRLVKDIKRAAGGGLGKFLGQLDALGFAAREGRGLLADMDVIQTDAVQGLEGLTHARDRLEELGRFLDRHVEHVGDALALEQDLQRLAVVALALADVAGDVDVRQKVHLDLDDAVALAGLAAAALDVEGEAAGFVAARFRLGKAGKPFADRREGTGIGRGVGAWRATDRRLVDVDDLVDVLEALDAIVRCGAFAGIVQLAGDRLVQRVDQQRRLAAAGDAGDAGEQAERNFGRDVLEVVAARVDHLDGAAMVRRTPFRHLDLELAREIFAGQRVGVAHDFGGRAFGDDVAAMHAGAGADVEHVVGEQDRVLVVLDHDYGVAEVTKSLQRVEQARVVALTKADRGLVEYVEHARQARANLRGQADALALAAGQRAGGAGECEVVE